MRGHSNRPLRRRSRRKENGIALITVLVLLMLLTAMGTAMMLSVNSDLMVNKYYRDFRGSFYAGDAGLAVVRQQMFNQLDAEKVFNFDPKTQQPLATGIENTVLKYIQDNYGNSYTTVNRDASTWPAKFIVDKNPANLSFTWVSCTPVGATGTCGAVTSGTPTSYIYVYNYHVVSYGQAAGAQKATVEETGTLRVTADLAPAGGIKTSFAAYGMFIDQNQICNSDGSTLVPGTISGPVWTNGSWTFGTSGSYIFTDAVTSVGTKAGYRFNGSYCDQKAAASDSYSGTTIKPSFAQPPTFGAKPAPLPDNDYNQLRAVLDGKGAPPCTDPSGATCASATQPSKAELHADLKTVNKTGYPSTGGPGVYLPYDVDASGNATFSGGGIYVEGNADITLSTSGTTGQVYTIKNNGVTTTITIDNTANRTSVCCDSTGKTVVITGVPQQIDPNTGAVIRDATMLYVNGAITSLKGPGEGANYPAIQDGTALTVTASGTVTITGDIRYKTEPVTMTQNQIPNTPADTLIPGNDSGQTLGIYTAGGDIQLNNKQSSGNLQVDASIASISATGSGGLVNTGSSISKLNIVGGRIQNTIKNINATTRNVFFDRRYANGLAPPWFPSTTISSDGKKDPTLSGQWYRTKWLSKSSF